MRALPTGKVPCSCITGHDKDSGTSCRAGADVRGVWLDPATATFVLTTGYVMFDTDACQLPGPSFSIRS
jgi:hypothetical protein